MTVERVPTEKSKVDGWYCRNCGTGPLGIAASLCPSCGISSIKQNPIVKSKHKLIEEAEKYFSEAEQINSSLRTRSIRSLKKAEEDYSKAGDCYLELAFGKLASPEEKKSYHHRLVEIDNKRHEMDEKIRKYRTLTHEEKMQYWNGERDL